MKTDISIQWQGTHVCGDFHCTCGAYAHICGATGMFTIRCHECGTVWTVPNTLTLERSPNVEGDVDTNAFVEGHGPLFHPPLRRAPPKASVEGEVCHIVNDSQLADAARAGILARGVRFTRCGLTWPPLDWPKGEGWVASEDQYYGPDRCPSCFPVIEQLDTKGIKS